MIKVLHSVLSLETGGLENGIVNLINHSSSEFKIDVLCLRARGPLADRIVRTGSEVRLAVNLQDHSLKAAIKAHQIAYRDGYDLVHAHGFTTMLSSFLGLQLSRLQQGSKARPKLINGEHGVFYADTVRRRVLQHGLFRMMDGNLAVSADLGSRLEKAFRLPVATFTPILNGVDIEKFKPDAALRVTTRQKLGFDDKQVIIGTVGRLVPVKNYPLLLRAVARLMSTYPAIQLVLCGDGEQRHELEKLAVSLDISSRVHFLGRIDWVHAAIQAFDVFTLTSDMEGLPNTVLEAMACQKAVVATDVGGSREVMPVGTGLLVPAGQEDVLVDKLAALIVDEQQRREFAEKARAHVVKHLSIKAMVAHYEQYYKRIHKS